MKRINFLRLTMAVMAVIGLSGTMFAQMTAPSLVTQQLRLSDGAGAYVNLRAGIGGDGTDNLKYFLDAAPTTAVGTNYALWLNDQNHIVRSTGFGPTIATPPAGFGQPGYLYRVNAAGNGTEWILPTDITDANNGLIVDKTTTPGTAIVQLGGTVTNTNPLTANRFVTLGGNTLNFDGAGNFNVGVTGSVMGITLDQGTAAGFVKMVNIPASVTPAATDRFMFLDGTNNVNTRLLSSLVDANNGLVIDATTTPGTAIVQLGSTASGTNTIAVPRFVTQAAGGSLTFDGAGSFNVGTGAATMNMVLDPGAAGTIVMNNIDPNPTPLATDRLVILDGTNTVLTRALTSLVDANNGLVIDATAAVPTVQLGGLVTGTNPLTANRFVTLGGNELRFDGAGTFTVGDGTAAATINLDQGTAAGSINLKNVAAMAAVDVAATNRFVAMTAAGDKVFTRDLSSLVDANNGLSTDVTTTPGTTIVQLGSATSLDAAHALSAARFVHMNGQSLSFENNGTMNLGVAGSSNMQVNVNTGTSAMTLTGAALASPNSTGVTNFAYVNSTTNEVHTLSTTAMTQQDVGVVNYIALDPTTNEIIKTVSPTAGIYRGHTTWTAWNQTITLGATQTIQPGATVTATIENHSGQGTISVQIATVTTGAGGSFQIEAADVPPSNGGPHFINWIVMNP